MNEEFIPEERHKGLRYASNIFEKLAIIAGAGAIVIGIIYFGEAPMLGLIFLGSGIFSALLLFTMSRLIKLAIEREYNDQHIIELLKRNIPKT